MDAIHKPPQVNIWHGGGVIFPFASLLSVPVQPELLAPASHPTAIPTAVAEALAAAELGGGNSSRTSENDIAALLEKVIASAEEIKHHNERTIKRGPSLAPWITNIAEVAPSPAGHERSRSDSASTVVTPGPGLPGVRG